MVNKIVGFFCCPTNVAVIGAAVALSAALLAARCRDATKLRRFSRGLTVGIAIWLWFWATPVARVMIGVPLERPYLTAGRIPSLESLPKADAIVLHGGSMGDNADLGGRGEMWTSADRVWMAARLWHRQAPAVKLFATGGGVKGTTAGLLADFGVPTNAVTFAGEPRNTEEEVRFLAGQMPAKSAKPRVLVVTSAWHMRRTMMMYEKYAPGVEAIPAPCDFENSLQATKGFSLDMLLPSDEALVANRVSLHEWIGICGYGWFR